jgi:DNA polymerase elongation subunit (family B)
MGLADCYDFMLWDKHAWGMPRIESFDFWLEFIDKHGVKLFVVDTLAHYLRPELEKVRNAINAYDYIYKVMERLQTAAVDTGCTFLLIHHDRKGDSDTDEARVLGTTALTAAADAVFQLKPMGDGVICLKATGNAFDDTVFYFTIRADNWLELTDKPATTKEEKAAKAIEDYLRQQGEATRQQLIDLMLEIGLAENKTTAGKLVDRAIQDRLATKIRKEFKGRVSVYYWQGGRATSPANEPDPLGGLKTTTTDIEFVSGVSNQGATRDIRDIRDNGRDVSIVSYSQPDPQRETPKTNPIDVSYVFNPDSPEGDPHGDPLATEAETNLFVDFFDAGILPNLIVEGSPQATQPETAGSQPDPLNEEWLWDWFTPESLNLPCAQAQSEVNPPAMPVSEPKGDLQATQPTGDPQEAPPDSEPKIEFIRINSISAQPEPDSEPEGDQPTEDALPAQPVATLNEPTCPICRIELEPEPDSGLAACLGCGRLFKVEIPPTSPEGDDSDDNPPISPDGDGGNPPNPQGNGHGGSQTGFAPPKTLSIPPVFPSANRIYSNKFNSPAILNRMTKRLPDGSIKLVWDDKTETVTPADLAGWQHIEEIPEVDLQDIESVEIPPVVVLDLETKGKDPQHGHILAVGLALFVAGKEVETQIFHNEGDEAALLFQVFDYLRETCDSLGDFILTGYNMFDFDLRFLIERSRRLRMKRACPFDYERDENGNIKRLPIPDTHGKYKYTAIKTTLPIMLIDTQHLVIRWDEFERVLTDYSLKSVAEHFGVNIPNRPKPTPEQIVHAFYHNRPLFDAYLLADLRETYAVFDILIEPYLGIAAFTGLDLEDLARKNGRGWVWEQHYERHYTEIPEADKTRKYKGGLVVCRKGLWFNCAKFDIASLYPTIALAYRIHSRKDPLQIGLRYLKTYTMKRLELKQKARETGDRSAQTLQSGLKVLINSYYGYFGSEYNFNDIEAAERVTEIGRKILTCMIAAVEDLGLLVVEADTDGIIVACQDRDPQEVLQVISDAIPPVFKVELERQGAVVFVSEMKNYMVFEPNGDLIEVKGGNWRGRDKPAFQTEAIPEFMKRWITQGVEAALDYARKVWAEIQSGNGWRWVVRTRRVGRGDKTLMQAGFKVGEKATYAYKNYKRREIALKPDEGYDQKYYADEFSDLVKKVIAAIDPAQIAAWERMVKQEARPLIFAG